jgi:hypothetical protein
MDPLIQFEKDNMFPMGMVSKKKGSNWYKNTSRMIDLNPNLTQLT